MATETAKLRPPLKTRYHHIFFPAFAALIAVIVFVGFAQTYFLSAILKVPHWKAGLAPPHPWIVEIHGAIFTAWIALLLLQSMLVAGHRVNLHRRLGLATIGLAGLMWPLAFAVSSEALARNFAPGDPRIRLASTNFLAVSIFAVLVSFAYRERSNPAAHKRLIFVATIQLVPAAIARFPIPGIGASGQTMQIGGYALLFLLVGYDLWSLRNVHRATLWGLLVFGLPFNSLIFDSGWWRNFSFGMQHVGQFLR